MSIELAAGPIGEEWIICLDAVRPVEKDGVACPMRDGAPVQLDACLDCHLLLTLSAERSRVGWCVAGDP